MDLILLFSYDYAKENELYICFKRNPIGLYKYSVASVPLTCLIPTVIQ